MSFDYSVFTRARPRLAETRDIGPVAISGPRKRSSAEEVWVMTLNCHHSASAIADAIATHICAASGGGWIVCDAYDATIAVAPDHRSAETDDIGDALAATGQRETARIVGAELARKQAELAAFNRAPKDPGANDWSDV